jgi:uncharacterized NAD(P)/FAD-binding protein YdhS
MTGDRTVLIVGGGASGALLAANLLRPASRGGPGDIRVVMIEPRAELGRGMAYSTTCPLHLLNVPAGKMSAFPDDTRHFRRWLAARGYSEYGADSFVPRMIYGDYIADILNSAASMAGGWRFRHIRRKATGFAESADGVRVRLADGTVVEGTSLVLAMGNAAPAPWPGLSPEVASSGRFFGMAWEADALNPGAKDEPVMLLGTGLTAVDAVLGLRWNGHSGPVYMVSRRGLAPQAHESFAGESIPLPPAESARGLFRNLRANVCQAWSGKGNWRSAVDSVRPDTNRLWQKLDLAEQRRFLRHMRAYWDVHRHRMAPQIAATMQQMIREGSLRVFAGRLAGIGAGSAGLKASIQLRGEAAQAHLEVGRIVNCTGPESNLARLNSPLVDDLMRQGRLVAHPLRTGALVDHDGALIDRAGHSSTRLFAIGPLRMGTLIETVAIPEIREQARDLADLVQTGAVVEFATAS